MSALAQQGAVDADRLQRLPQIVACGREELGLGPSRGFGGAASLVSDALFRDQLPDQYFVFETTLDGFGDGASEIAPEEQGKTQYRRHDDSARVVGWIVLRNHAPDERQ